MPPGNRKAPARAASSESSYSLMEFTRDFPDDETCLRWLWTTRYAPDGVHALCPRCDAEREFHRYETKQQRQSWTCTACSLHIHPTAGTIFHKSSTALHLWFYAMYLMTSTRCGISAKQLERELGVTYKTAWRMFTLIRNELMSDEGAPLSGVVEMDETYVGGKPRLADKAQWAGMEHSHERRQAAQKWSDKKKAKVFGMVERNHMEWIDGTPKPTVARHGKVAAFVVPSVRASTLGRHIEARVQPGSEIHTDEGKAYRGLSNAGWAHETINHGDGVYVSGNVHTQSIEGFWSLVKRGIDGTHHAVSPKWLQGYLNEYVWRYNHRDDGRAMFLTLLLRSAEPAA